MFKNVLYTLRVPLLIATVLALLYWFWMVLFIEQGLPLWYSVTLWVMITLTHLNWNQEFSREETAIGFTDSEMPERRPIIVRNGALGDLETMLYDLFAMPMLAYWLFYPLLKVFLAFFS